jgi:urease
MQIGKTMLGRRHVMPSVISSLDEMMVEGTFRMGTYLVTVHHPISTDDGDLEKALYGSFLPIPSQDLFPLPDPASYEPSKLPGAVITVKGKKIVLKDGRKRIKLKVTSKGDRPVQVRHSRAQEEYGLKIIRLVHITTLSRQTHSWSSIV